MRVFLLVAFLLNSVAIAQKSNSSILHHTHTRMIDVGGTKMYCEVSGKGPPILFLHTGLMDCRMWDDQVRSLSRRYMVIRCDLRGYGKTPRGSVRFSHYRDIATLLDSLGIAKVHLVGASFGGKVAIDVALAFPQRIRSLVLCAPDISGTAPTAELLSIDSTEESYLKKYDFVHAAEFNVRTWVVGPYRRAEEVSVELQQKIIAMQLHNYSIPSPEGAQNVPLEPRAMRRIGEIRIPTLILIGDKDIRSFQTLSEIIANGIPTAIRIVIPNVAHMIPMEKPELFNHMLLDFITNK